MKRFFVTISLVCVFATAFADFPDLNGQWIDNLAVPYSNNYPIYYIFKVTNDKLTGTATFMQRNVNLIDGKVKNDSFSFAINVDGVKVWHIGKYFKKGDSVSLNIYYKGRKIHYKLQRLLQED